MNHVYFKSTKVIKIKFLDATLSDVLKYIDTSGDSDERRERMRQVFSEHRIQTQINVDLLN